jgi:hypothetical protein
MNERVMNAIFITTITKPCRYSKHFWYVYEWVNDWYVTSSEQYWCYCTYVINYSYSYPCSEYSINQSLTWCYIPIIHSLIDLPNILTVPTRFSYRCSEYSINTAHLMLHTMSEWLLFNVKWAVFLLWSLQEQTWKQ